MKTILITGGTGLVGKALTKLLTENGYLVKWLTRKINPSESTPQYTWDWKNKKIEIEALTDVDAIINLAGASINGRKWTKQWKKEIYDSRIKSTEFLFDTISKEKYKIQTFVSISAVGYYGAVTSEKTFVETDTHANDFLGNTCFDWEQQANRFKDLGIRTVIIRTGIVLAKESEAFKKIIFPIRFNLGAALGSGKQIFPWIHIEDLCSILMKSVSDETIEGAYNAVAPEQLTNKELMQKLSVALDKNFFLPNIPSFILNLVFGELAVSLLNGSKISPDKLIKAGYEFQFKNLMEATKELLIQK